MLDYVENARYHPPREVSLSDQIGQLGEEPRNAIVLGIAT
jgi:hypothetical protein